MPCSRSSSLPQTWIARPRRRPSRARGRPGRSASRSCPGLREVARQVDRLDLSAASPAPRSKAPARSSSRSTIHDSDLAVASALVAPCSDRRCTATGSTLLGARAASESRPPTPAPWTMVANRPSRRSRALRAATSPATRAASRSRSSRLPRPTTATRRRRARVPRVVDHRHLAGSP